jgi:hypothetical protein
VKLTDEQARMLAKVGCAERMSGRVGGKIPRALSALSFGYASRATYDHLMSIGLIAWNNGSVLTKHGRALLNEILNARAEQSK